MPERDKTITATPNLINILAGNPGVQFTPATLAAAADGRTQWFDGCVHRLFYNTKGNDLDAVQISGAHPGTVTADNLNDFRERFEQAACCGFRVAFCVLEGKRIVMLHLYPCQCECDDRD